MALRTWWKAPACVALGLSIVGCSAILGLDRNFTVQDSDASAPGHDASADAAAVDSALEAQGSESQPPDADVDADTPVNPCATGTHPCGSCVLDTDPKNCGSACNTNCPGPSRGAGSPACAGNSCAIACTSGTLCGTACVDTTGDAMNCGGCGHSCLPGKCSGGRCQAWAVANQFSIGGLATDGVYVAWDGTKVNGDSPSIYDIPIAGTTAGLKPQPLSGPPHGGPVAGITVANGKVVWVVNGPNGSGSSTISFVDEGSTTVTTSGPNNTGGNAFAVGLDPSGAHLYVADGTGVSACSPLSSTAACGPVASLTMANAGPHGAFAFNGSSPAFFEGGGSAMALTEVSLPGGVQSSVSAVRSPSVGLFGVAADAQNVYWGTFTAGTSSTPPTLLFLYSAPRNNIQSTSTLVSNLGAGSGFDVGGTIAADGTNVYLSAISATSPGGASYIAWIPGGGGTLSSPIYSTPNEIRDLRAVGGSLYWIEFVPSDANTNFSIWGMRFFP